MTIQERFKAAWKTNKADNPFIRLPEPFVSEDKDGYRIYINAEKYNTWFDWRDAAEKAIAAWEIAQTKQEGETLQTSEKLVLARKPAYLINTDVPSFEIWLNATISSYPAWTNALFEARAHIERWKTATARNEATEPLPVLHPKEQLPAVKALLRKAGIGTA